MKNLFSIAFCFSICLQALSTSAAGSKKVHQLVDQYYSQKTVTTAPAKANPKTMLGFLNLQQKPGNPFQNNGCFPDNSKSCVDVACEKLGWAGCDDLDEIKTVGQACRGNWNGTCVTKVCDKLGWAGCDDMDEVSVVARACVGNTDGQCFESICQKLGWSDCDDEDEVVEVLNACSGN